MPMSFMLEVPQILDLDGLSVDVATSDAPGIVSVTAWANDGDVVTVTWDEIAASVGLRRLSGNDERLVLARETASKVSIHEEQREVVFRVWSRSEGVGGHLVVRVGERVAVSDEILQR